MSYFFGGVSHKTVFTIEQLGEKYFSLPSTGDVSYFVSSLIVSQAGETAERMLLLKMMMIIKHSCKRAMHQHTLCKTTVEFASALDFSLCAGTSNRKLTVLCDSMECSREQQTSSADLHPATTMRLFVPAFPSKSRAVQSSFGREKTCHISALFFVF